MYFIGIDVSMKESALCILDRNGKIVRETKLPTDPAIIAGFIATTGLAIERIGLESGCTAAWLFGECQFHASLSAIAALLLGRSPGWAELWRLMRRSRRRSRQRGSRRARRARVGQGGA